MLSIITGEKKNVVACNYYINVSLTKSWPTRFIRIRTFIDVFFCYCCTTVFRLNSFDIALRYAI